MLRSIVLYMHAVQHVVANVHHSGHSRLRQCQPSSRPQPSSTVGLTTQSWHCSIMPAVDLNSAIATPQLVPARNMSQASFFLACHASAWDVQWPTWTSCNVTIKGRLLATAVSSGRKQVKGLDWCTSQHYRHMQHVMHAVQYLASTENFTENMLSHQRGRHTHTHTALHPCPAGPLTPGSWCRRC